MKIRPLRGWGAISMRTDGQDMTKLKVAFRNFTNASTTVIERLYPAVPNFGRSSCFFECSEASGFCASRNSAIAIEKEPGTQVE